MKKLFLSLALLALNAIQAKNVHLSLIFPDNDISFDVESNGHVHEITTNTARVVCLLSEDMTLLLSITNNGSLQEYKSIRLDQVESTLTLSSDNNNVILKYVVGK